jgi:hypothetical protein
MPGVACKLLRPPQPTTSAADNHFKQRKRPHHPYSTFPATGPTAQLNATQHNEQQRMCPPSGKNLHFVDLKRDAAGVCGIHIHLQRPFTPSRLSSYHPHSDTLPPAIRQHIIDSHNAFRTFLQTIDKRSEPTPPAFHWPYTPNPSSDLPTTPPPAQSPYLRRRHPFKKSPHLHPPHPRTTPSCLARAHAVPCHLHPATQNAPTPG